MLAAERRARPAALVGAALLALAAWLLLPLHGPAAGAPARVLLVDESASVRRTRPAPADRSARSSWSAWVRTRVEDEVRAAGAAGEEVLLVRYAAEVATGDVADLDGRRTLTAEGSDLQGALALVEAWAARRGGVHGKALLLGDGEYTGVDPRPSLGRLGAGGLSFELVRPPESTLPDLVVTRLSVPRHVEVGAPLAAEVELRLAPWRGAGSVASVQLEVELENRTGTRRFDVLRAVPVSGAPWSTRLELGRVEAGRTVVRVRGSLEGDPVPENDARSSSLLAGEESVVVLVASAAARPEAERWLSPRALAGIQVVPLELAELPGAWNEFDAVVSVDLGEVDLVDTGWEDFVRRGGGWLACGGPRLFAGGGQGGLPLVPVPEEGPGRDVVLLLDGSGSMAGEPFEAVRAAVLSVLPLARPSDRFYLRFFTDTLDDEHVLGAGGASTERAARVLLSARRPRGPTDVFAALEQLAREREAGGRPALVLLLSDGRDPSTAAESAARAEELRDRLVRAQVRTAVVAMGERADRGFLAQLVAPGEELLAPETPEALSELFRDEVAGERERRAASLAVRPAERGSLRTDESAALLSALTATAPAGFPGLERLHRTVPRSARTDVLLWSAEGDPVLALESTGLGRVAAWVSAPLAGWAADWAGRPELVAPLLRTLVRTRRAGLGERRALRAGERLWVEGVGEWPALVIGRLRPEGGAASSATVELSVPPSGAGSDPRSVRAGVWPAELPWGGSFTLEVEGEAFALTREVAPEFAAGILKPADLSTVPGVGGSPSAGGAGEGLAGLGRPHPAGVWALLAGLGLSLLAAVLGWEKRARRRQGMRPAGR